MKEVEEKAAKEEQVAIPDASTLFFDGSYKRSLHQSIGGFLILDALGGRVNEEGSNSGSQYE